MECASAYFCHDFLVSPLTCTRDGARTRSQDGENDMSEEPFQCGICDELCKGTKYAHSSTLVLSDSHGPSIPRHAHHRLMESRSNFRVAVLPLVLRTPAPAPPYQHTSASNT